MKNLIKIGRGQIEATPTRKRAHRGAGQAQEALAISNAVTIDPAALAPSVTPADNMLLASVKDTDITLTLTALWEFPSEGDVVTFQLVTPLEAGVIDLITEDFGGNQPTVPYSFTLRAADRTLEGRYYVEYTVQYAGGGSEKSDRIPITVDYTAPGYGAVIGPLRFDAADEILEKGIRPAIYRDTDGTPYVWSELYTYGDTRGATPGILFAPGDTVQLYADGVAMGDPTAVQSVNGHLEQKILASDLEELGSGDVKFTYKITDRAGNVSEESDPVTVTLILDTITPAEPAVPAYDGDTPGEEVIDETDARGVANNGFLVSIPRDAGMEDNDAVMLYLDGEAAGPVAVGSADPIEVFMPYSVSQTIWERGSNGDDIKVNAAVSYSVLRSSVVIGTSQPHAIALNLFMNVPDPDPGTPENEAYPKPVVESASGETDHIPVADFGKNATVTIVPSTTDTPPAPTMKQGDVVRVHYGNSTLSDFLVPEITDPTVALEIALPGTTISDEGSSPALPVWYEVVHTLTGGGTNVGTSPRKTIRVEGTDGQPGKGKLEKGTFPEATLSNSLIPRADLEDGTEFVIPGNYENRDATDGIVLSVRYYLPGAIAESHPDSEHDELAGRHFEQSQTAGPGTEDIVMTIPKTRLVQQWEDGLSQYMHAHVTYTITKSSGDTTPVTSDPAFVRIDGRGNP